MLKKNMLSVCLIIVSLISMPCEARAVVVTKITDGRATQAYIKQVQELAELYEQGKKLQTQIEQMQQSLEHFDFKNIDQAYNFLNDTMMDMEKIEKKSAGMAVTIGELEDNWTEMHTDYNAEDMTPEKRAELEKKRKERLERNAKISADILSASQDLKRERKQMDAIRNDLALLDSGKASPIKAAQVMTQMLTYQMEQQKRTQKLIAEKMRNELIKEEMRKDEEKQVKAEADRQKDISLKAIEEIAKNNDIKDTFGGAMLDRESFSEAVHRQK